MQESIIDGVRISEYRSHLSQNYGERVGIWGLPEKDLGRWLDIDPGDWVIFATDQDEWRYCLPVLDKVEDRSLAEKLSERTKHSDSSSGTKYPLLLILGPYPESKYENISLGELTGDSSEQGLLMELSSGELQKIDDTIQKDILEQHETLEQAIQASSGKMETELVPSEQEQQNIELIHHLSQQLATDQHLLLYGPPGTRKYGLASRIADELGTGRRSSSGPDSSWAEQFDGHELVDHVQFDSNTTYEDFVEREESSPIGTKAGPLKKVCREAEESNRRRTSRHTSVLILEQFGEANLPEVFGETIAIFSSVREVTLQHSGEQLSLPDSVHIIAVADTPGFNPNNLPTRLHEAFTFAQISPDYEILAKRHEFLEEDIDEYNGLAVIRDQITEATDELTASIGRSIIGLAEVNRTITERKARPNTWGATIGHAPLDTDIDSKKQLVNIWKHKLFPQIVDRFEGDIETLQEELFNGNTPEVFYAGMQSIDSRFSFDQLQSDLKLMVQ